MSPADINEYVGYLLGAFGSGYSSGLLLLYFKKAAGLIR
jgi:hypothetical protein